MNSYYFDLHTVVNLFTQKSEISSMKDRLVCCNAVISVVLKLKQQYIGFNIAYKLQFLIRTQYYYINLLI